MPPVAIDMTIVVLILGMTYALSSEGAWGAALMFFNILFAGIITFNFYETLANLLAENAPGMASWADLVCYMGLFLVTLIILRVMTDSIAPAMVRLPTPIYHLGRLIFGFAGACVSIAILILAFHVAPVQRKIFGVMDWETQPPFKQGLDRKWLAFVQYTTGNTFANFSDEAEDDPEFGQARFFDPRGSWLLDHQTARPFHSEGQADLPIPPDPDAPVAAPATPPAGQ